MTANAIYQDQDMYAENVSTVLKASGLVNDEQEEEMKRFLRGW